MRWRDVAGPKLRRTWTAHWRRQPVEVILLDFPQQRASPPTSFPSCGPFSSELPLARSARSPRLVGTTANAHQRSFRSRFSDLEREASQADKQQGCLRRVTKVRNNPEHVSLR